jgi:hypothetical protein
MLGDEGGGAGTTGRVEHDVAGVGGHQHTTLDDPLIRLDDVNLIWRAAKTVPPIEN